MRTVIIFVLASCLSMRCAPSGPPARSRHQPTRRSAADPSRGPQTPQDIVRRAVRVAGGHRALRQGLSAYTAEFRGELHETPYTMTRHWLAPDGLTEHVHSWTLEQGQKGAVCWDRYRDVVGYCHPGDAKSGILRNTVYHLATIYPALDPGTELARADPATIHGRPADGVEVTTPDKKAIVVMHFDRETGHLVQVSYTGSWGNEDGLMQFVFSEHRRFGALVFPTREEVNLNGRQVVAKRMTRLHPGRVDRSRIGLPKDRPVGTTRVHREPEKRVICRDVPGPLAALGSATRMMQSWMGDHGRFSMNSPHWFLRRRQPLARSELCLLVIPPRRPQSGGPYRLKTIPSRLIASRVTSGTPPQVVAEEPQLRAWIKKHGWRITGPLCLVNHRLNQVMNTLVSELYYPVARAPRRD